MSSLKTIVQRSEQIVYCLGASNYCWLHFRSGEKKLVAKPISFMQAQLPAFVRVHKTALLNPLYIESWQIPLQKKSVGKVQLDSGEIFPVSRRRWPVLVEQQLGMPAVALVGRQVQDVTHPRLPAPTPLAESVKPSIILVTDDAQKAQLAEQLTQQEWGTYQFEVSAQASLLTTTLSTLPVSRQPTLLILDAQTATLERLNSLRRLKAHPHLCHLPVILVVLPLDSLVIEGYQCQANSVVAISNQAVVFTQHLQRILRFWLQIAALPELAGD